MSAPNLLNFPINSKGNVEIPKDDFFYIVDRLVAESNDNYILKQRVTCLEHIIKWCLNYVTFIHSFSTLFFQNELPLSAVILNNDMFRIPFLLVETVETAMININTHLAAVYDQCGLMGVKMAKVLETYSSRRPQLDSHKLMEYIAQLNKAYDTFVLQYNDNSVNFSFVAPFKTLTTSELNTLTAKMHEAADLIGLKFSPEYLVKQALLSQSLMYFASSVFSFVPQLKTDFLFADNAAFSVDAYAQRIHAFWREQVNVCIEPFYLAYKHKNMFNATKKDVDDVFNRLFVAANAADKKLSSDTQLLLRLYEQNSMKLRFSDPINQNVADAWRRLFVAATDKNVRTVRLEPLTDAQRKDLFTNFLADVVGGQQSMFEEQMVFRTHSMYMANRSDFLTNMKYTFFEQCCLLKLVIRYILQRWYIGDKPTFGGYDPLEILVEKIFWKPAEIFQPPKL